MRIDSVDVFRFIAIIAVVVIHTSPFRFVDEGLKFQIADIVINQSSRFAVPFFFVISGYFYGYKFNQDKVLTDLVKRTVCKLALIFCFWSLFYILPFNVIGVINELGYIGLIKVVYWKVNYFFNNPLMLFFQGTGKHLWFIPSLICAVLVSSIFLYYKAYRMLAFVATGLFILGVLGTSYSSTFIGIELDFNARNGPFFSTIFFVIGIYLNFIKINQSTLLLLGIILFMLGWAGQLTEVYFLRDVGGTYSEPDFVFSTLAFGSGFAMVSLSNAKIFKVDKLSGLGRRTLGVYVIHMVYVDFLKIFDEHSKSMLWQFLYVALVVYLSIYTAVLLSRMKFFKNLV
jgi:surface polysaccharide O-acyltransferase-like enzyme